MRAPRGGNKPGDRAPSRPARKGSARPPRPPLPHAFPEVSDGGFAMDTPRPFRGPADFHVESTAGLRHEIIDLRAEVHRLAAEIDKLWARERGRAAAPGRTARSIAGKPVRTGTRAARPNARGAAPAAGGAASSRTAAPRAAAPGSRGAAASKRTSGGKRGSGWAKPKSRSHRSGTTPRRQGR
jgi:hypothetical protein